MYAATRERHEHCRTSAERATVCCCRGLSRKWTPSDRRESRVGISQDIESHHLAHHLKVGNHREKDASAFLSVTAFDHSARGCLVCRSDPLA
jgi:hypothetical protein